MLNNNTLILQDRILGVLYLAGKLTQRALPKEDLIVLRAIGNQVAIALGQILHFGHQQTDALQQAGTV